MKKVLVIGSGSVAKKHIINLLLLGYEPILLAKNRLKNYFKSEKKISYTKDFKNIKNKEILFVLICNSTNKHFKYLKIFLKKKIHIYCEKPIVNKSTDLCLLKKKLKKNKKLFLLVGYQLHRNKTVKSLKSLLKNKKVVSSNVYVGHNIKYWRKNYRKQSYYLNYKKGGGVIFELIHEINLIKYLFGEITFIKTLKKKAISGAYEDLAVSIFKTNKNIIGTINQEMINENYKRNLSILTVNEQIDVDIFTGMITISKKNKVVKRIFCEKYDQMSMLKRNLQYFINCLKRKKIKTINQELNNSLNDVVIANKMHND